MNAGVIIAALILAGCTNQQPSAGDATWQTVEHHREKAKLPQQGTGKDEARDLLDKKLENVEHELERLREETAPKPAKGDDR